MNPDPWRWTLLGVAGVLGGVAVAAGPNETVAAPAAGGALLAAAGFALLSIIERVHLRLPPRERMEGDRLVALRQAFAEGAIGRQRIAQAVLELERETLGRAATQEGDPVALHPEEASDDEFRRWVVARMDRLEGTT